VDPETGRLVAGPKHDWHLGRQILRKLKDNPERLTQVFYIDIDLISRSIKIYLNLVINERHFPDFSTIASSKSFLIVSRMLFSSIRFTIDTYYSVSIIGFSQRCGSTEKGPNMGVSFERT
jgi:hypothetical protein